MLKISLFVLAAIFTLATQAFCLPQDPQVAEGEAVITYPDEHTMNISAANNTIINYGSFSIMENETVIMQLPSVDSAILNRVLGTEYSQLLGTLQSNGLVILVNENGIYVGPNANLQAAGLALSTRDITNENFLNANYVFKRLSKEELDMLLVNQGNITISNKGFAALIAGAIENNGNIIAQAGHIALAAGDAVKLELSANRLISVAILEKQANDVVDFQGNKVLDQIKNTGRLEAATVILKAESLPDIFEKAINLEGYVKATKLETGEGGIVRITADGDVRIAATVEADEKIEIETESKIEILDIPETNINTDYIYLKAKNFDVKLDTPAVAFEKTADLYITASRPESDYVTVETRDSDRISYLGTANVSITAPAIDQDPAVLIQAASLKLISDRFGTHASPLRLQAQDIHIKSLSMPLEILQSQGLGSTIMITGPPEQGLLFFEYNRDANLTLEASKVSLVGSDPISLYGNIQFVNFECTVPDKEIYFEAGKTYTFQGTTRIEGVPDGVQEYLIKLRSQTPGEQYSLKVEDSYKIDYVNISDANAVNHLFIPVGVDLGNNTNLEVDPVWDGGAAPTDYNWSTPQNWVGDIPPSYNSDVTFDATSSKDCIIDVSISINNLTIDGYTGTIELRSELTVMGDYYQTSGTFNSTSAGVMIFALGDANKDIINAGGSATFYDLKLIHATGTTEPRFMNFSGNFTVQRDLIVDSVPGTGTWNALSFNDDALININRNLVIQGTVACQFGSRIQTNPFFPEPPQNQITVNLGGNLQMSNGILGSHINFVGTGTQYVYTTGGQVKHGTWTIDKASGTVEIMNDLLIGNTFFLYGPSIVLNNGVLNTNDNSLFIWIVTQNGGVFNLGSADCEFFGYYLNGGTLNTGSGKLMIVGFIQAGGVFNNSTSPVEIGAFNQSGGVFNAPSDLSIIDSFVRTGGVFTQLSGATTVYTIVDTSSLNPDAFQFNPGDAQFNDLIFTNAEYTLPDLRGGTPIIGPPGSGAAFETHQAEYTRQILGNLDVNGNLRFENVYGPYAYRVEANSHVAAIGESFYFGPNIYVGSTFASAVFDGSGTGNTIQASSTWTDEVRIDGTGSWTALFPGIGASHRLYIYNGTLDAQGLSLISLQDAVGEYVQTGGRFIAPLTLLVDYVFSISGGTFEHRNGTVVMQVEVAVASIYVASSSTPLYNLVIQRGSGPDDAACDISGNPKVLNDFTINSNDPAGMVVTGVGTIDVAKNMYIAGVAPLVVENITVNLSGDLRIDNTNSNIRNNYNFVGAADQDIYAPAPQTYLQGGTWRVDKPSGTLRINNDLSLILAPRFVVDRGTVSTGSYNVFLFNFEQNGGVLNCGSGKVIIIFHSQNGGVFNGGSGPVEVIAYNQSGGTFNAPANFSIIDSFIKTGGSFAQAGGTTTVYTIMDLSIINPDTLKFEADNAAFNNLLFTNAAYTLINPLDGAVVVGPPGSGAFFETHQAEYTRTMGGSITTRGYFTMDNAYGDYDYTIIAPALITAYGDFNHYSTNSTSAEVDFDPNGGNVLFDGGDQNIRGDTTFYDFTRPHASSLIFEAGSTQTIQNNLTLLGGGGRMLRLISSSAGSLWNIDPQGAINASYLIVQDSFNQSLVDINPPNSLDGGSTFYWFTPGTLPSSYYVWSGISTGNGPSAGILGSQAVSGRTWYGTGIDVSYETVGGETVFYWQYNGQRVNMSTSGNLFNLLGNFVDTTELPLPPDAQPPVLGIDNIPPFAIIAGEGELVNLDYIAPIAFLDVLGYFTLPDYLAFSPLIAGGLSGSAGGGVDYYVPREMLESLLPISALDRLRELERKTGKDIRAVLPGSAIISAEGDLVNIEFVRWDLFKLPDGRIAYRLTYRAADGTDIFRYAYEDTTEQYRLGYSRGRYRVTVVQYVDETLIVAPYDSRGPRYNDGEVLNGKGTIIREKQIL